LINKTDLVDDETIAKIERDILGFEPNAVISKISALHDVPDEAWQKAVGECKP
jgi:G3E family GTPase